MVKNLIFAHETKFFYHREEISLSKEPHQTKTKIGLFTATSIVVANMVGTGVFTSLGFQVLDIQSGFPILMLWLLGGVFALAGALSYGELGSIMPRSGGEFHYLSKLYHPSVGFVSGWVSMTVGFAAPVALAAIALGEYFTAIFHQDPLNAVSSGEGLDMFHVKMIAFVVIVSVSFIHAQNIRIGSYFQNIFTGLKIVIILFLIIVGFLLGDPQDIPFMPQPGDADLLFGSSFAVSLVFVMYAYSGWNASSYIASEIEQPERNLPRSLFIGTAFVTVIYILINLVFLYSTPIDAMAGQVEVGFVAALHILGEDGGRLMGLFIALGLISSISSMIWTGPRVTQVMGEDIPFFRKLSKKNGAGVPFIAILVQLVISAGLAVTMTFETVASYTIFTLILSSCVTVAGVFVSRYKDPDLERPYKTWGYPVTPAIFIVISLWMLTYIAMSKPLEALGGIATIGVGLIIYFLTNQKGDSKTSEA